ncbi:MAG TPA: hypothetical protein PKE20_00150 [Promineifilum sp.]|nr:hypothetical protein [Promineifilum sp.]
MTNKRRKVDYNGRNIKGNTTVTGGSIIRTNQEPVVVPGGDNFADVKVSMEDVTGDTTIAGGHVIDAVTFDARLDELERQLLAHYAAEPETRGRITLLAEELAAEAQRPPAERDTGRAQRWLAGLQQFALGTGAGAAGQLLAEAFRVHFLT